MVVGLLQMELHLPASHSLKAKRSVVNHVKERLRTRFNASVAEVDSQDLWQRATLGVAVVSGEPSVLDRVLHDILACVEREARLAVLDYPIRIDCSFPPRCLPATRAHERVAWATGSRSSWLKS